MDKILYRKITSFSDKPANDKLVLVVQALIDKQAELVEFVDGLQGVAEKQEIVK